MDSKSLNAVGIEPLSNNLFPIALYLSYQAGGAASIIGPLSATRVLVTIGLAMLLLKERTNTANKILGATVTIIGVILLL